MFSYLNFDHTLDDTDVRYDGKLKINNASLLFDWYVTGGNFHLTASATNGGLKLEAVGRPSGGTYELNGTTYTAAQVGSIGGRLKFGNSVAPYLGVGCGNWAHPGDSRFCPATAAWIWRHAFRPAERVAERPRLKARRCARA